MPFVLDCSVLAGWMFVDGRNSYVMAAYKCFSTDTVCVSPLIYWEAANALATAVRRGRVGLKDAESWIQELLNLSFVIDEEGMPTNLPNIWMLARTYSLTAYDATYLELAQRTGLPLATLDDRLRRAAAAAGVAVWQPN